MISLRRAPITLRTPISRVRLGDRHEHDVHYPDAADQQADRGDHHHDQANGADQLAELADQGFGAGDAEVIRVGRLDAAAAAGDFR